MHKLLRTMGCVKSKKRDHSAEPARGRGGGDKAYLVRPDGQSQDGRPAPENAALLDYAHRLSEEIVSRAVQQWAELDRRYLDIPYIECDTP
ncbi:small membrane A-kinase anchor protein [Eucyclogobius newberryi]|uniref:small membrane A-kinase anchor protein n=1 Tax=Eucyclogobius newberryi TaxID=166745 RepID=UPI003B599166